jgi:hypothetical protein
MLGRFRPPGACQCRDCGDQGGTRWAKRAEARDAAAEISEGLIEVTEVTREEGAALLDGAAREELDISGEEFLARRDAGEYDPCDHAVAHVAMLIPFGR